MKQVSGLSFADVVTLTAVGFSTTAILLVGITSTPYLACGLGLMGLLLDFLDGRIARMYGSSAIGKTLDSLNDVLGFAALPSLLVVKYAAAPSALCVAISVIYTIAVVYRLARFTTVGFADSKLTYTGMPSFYSVFPVSLIAVLSGNLSLLLMLLMAPLMVSKIPFPKPKHPVYGLLVFGVAIGFLVYGLT